MTDELEAQFRAARQAPGPGPVLTAILMADAARALAPAAPAPRPRSRLLAALALALGGWPSLAGMATAAAAGVWIGFASPDLVQTYLPLAAETEAGLDAFLPDLAALAEEE